MHRKPVYFSLVFSTFVINAPCQTSEQRPALTANGMPSTSRNWSGDDYISAGKLVTSKTIKLPKYSDPEGASILARITSLKNLDQYRIKSVPLDSRFRGCSGILQGCNPFMYGYLSGGPQFLRENRKEASSLMAFVLHATCLALDIAEEMKQAIPGGPNHEEQLKQFTIQMAKMNAGFTKTVVSLEVTISNQAPFDDENISVLLEALASTMPRLSKILPDSTRQHLLAKYQNDKILFSKLDDLQNINKIIMALTNY